MSAKIAGFLSVILLLWGTLAHAETPAASLVGARPLDAGATGAWVAVGVPDVEVGVRVGQNSLSDIGGRLRLSWGTGTTFGGFGTSANFLSRLRFAHIGGWDVAAVAEPGVFIHGGVEHWAPLEKAKIFRTSTLMGIDCGVPGIQASSWVTPSVHLAIGLSAPIRVHFAPETTLELPVLFQVASEVVVGDRFSAVAMGEIGTTFYGPGAGSPTSDLVYRLRLGVGWR